MSRDSALVSLKEMHLWICVCTHTIHTHIYTYTTGTTSYGPGGLYVLNDTIILLLLISSSITTSKLVHSANYTFNAPVYIEEGNK